MPVTLRLTDAGVNAVGEKRRKGKLLQQLRILFDHLINQFPGLGDLGGVIFLATTDLFFASGSPVEEKVRETQALPLSREQKHNDSNGINQTEIGHVGGGQIIKILLAALITFLLLGQRKHGIETSQFG